MATTYYADNYGAPPLVAPGGWPLRREFSFLVSVAFVINDIVRLMTFPGLGPGIIVDFWYLYVPIIDSGGGASTVAYELGDVLSNTSLPAETGTGAAYVPSASKYMAIQTPAAGAAATYFSQSNGQAGVLPFSYAQFGPNNSGGLYDLAFQITTAPNIGATGVRIKGEVAYHMAGPTPTV
jgi:hypothetical protein